MKKAYVSPEVEYINFYSEEEITSFAGDGISTPEAESGDGWV
jgi:hypothetical protein